jgi:hypothetical protein
LNGFAAADAGAAETAIAAGVLREVQLMVVLGVIERARGPDFGGDRAEAGLARLALVGAA